MFQLKPNGKNHSRSYVRHQRRRHIKRKLFILQKIHFYHAEYFTSTNIGKLHKGKVHCSCKMCKFEKHYNIQKGKYKFSKQDIQKELEEYYSY